MIEIGAGGGSIARIDASGCSRSGPRARARGPARPATGAAATRADRDRRRPGAGLPRSRLLPRRAMRARPRRRPSRRSPSASADRSGSTPSEAAWGIHQVVNERWPAPRACTPSSAARTRAAARCSPSVAPARCTPTAWRESCGCRELIVPFGAGVSRRSAFSPRRSPSTSCAPTTAGWTRSTGRRRAGSSPRWRRGPRLLPRPASPPTRSRCRAGADMRYAGRATRCACPSRRAARRRPARRAPPRFETDYRRLYGHAARGAGGSDHLAGRRLGPRPALPLPTSAGRRAGTRGPRERAAPGLLAGGAGIRDCRSTIATGWHRAPRSTGPAIVEERESTVVVARPPGSGVDDGSNVIVRSRRSTRRSGERRMIDPITLEVLWNRLIAVVNEQAAALMRTRSRPSCASRGTSRPASSTPGAT